MTEWATLGKIFIVAGLCVALVGLLLLVADRLPGLPHLLGWFGRLPGDITIRRENFSFSFPFTTSILLSILVSLLFYLVAWIIRR